MPWTASNTINSLKKKSLEIRQLFADVANAVLEDGGSEEEAIEAGLSAVSKKEGKVRVKKSVEIKTVPSVPSHLSAIIALKAKRQAEQPETFVEKATRATTTALGQVSEEINTNILFKQNNRLKPDPERSLVGIDWDKKDRLVLKFDDGAELVSPPVPNTGSIINSSVVVAGSNAGGTSSGVAVSFETVSKNLDAVGATYQYSITGELESITYSNGIVKALNYTDGLLTSAVLSGSTPDGINLTKTFTYSGDDLVGANYT